MEWNWWSGNLGAHSLGLEHRDHLVLSTLRFIAWFYMVKIIMHKPWGLWIDSKKYRHPFYFLFNHQCGILQDPFLGQYACRYTQLLPCMPFKVPGWVQGYGDCYHVRNIWFHDTSELLCYVDIIGHAQNNTESAKPFAKKRKQVIKCKQ